MELSSSVQRRALAAVISLIGILVSWLSGEPATLLISVAATTICFGWLPGLVAVGVFGMIATAILFPTASDPNAVATRLAVYVSCAMGLWTLVHVFRTTSFYAQVYKTVQPSADDIPGLGWSAYPDGRMRFVNPAATDFVGVSAEEMQEIMDGDPNAWWDRFVHPDDIEGCKARWLQSLKTGEPLIDEQRVRKHDGTYRWFRDSAVASRDERGNITGWHGTTADIDDQKRAEAALRESERKLQYLIDTVPALIWCADPEGNTTYINNQLQTWFGLSAERDDVTNSSKLTTTIIDAVHPDDRHCVAAVLAKSFAAGEPFGMKYRQRRADGEYRWIDGKAQPLRDANGGILQWYAVFLDINEEITAHEAVRQSEAELQVLVETVPSLIWLMTPAGLPYYFNKRFLEWAGVQQLGELSQGPYGKETHVDLIHPDDRASVAETFQRAFESGLPLHIKGRLRRRDGQYRWVDSRVEPLRDHTGKIIRWYGVSFDIEEEVKAQAALVESERYLQHLIDTVPVGIVLSDPGGQPVYVNRRLSDRTGAMAMPAGGEAEIRIGDALWEIVHPDDRDAVYARLGQCREAGESFAMRYRQRRSDGVYRWIEHRSEPFYDKNGALAQWYGVNLDVDDEVKAQEGLRLADERLARASRAASLSELSVSIAHELNQPLQAMVSNANAFERWLAAEPPNFERARKTAEWIIRDAEAAGEVIGRTRALFSQTEHRRELVNVNGVIADVCELLADRLTSSQIRLELSLDAAAPETSADRVQIEQVVMNLVRNAAEALQVASTDVRRISIATNPGADGWVEVVVSDNGSGILHPERIFDPFYTTKGDGVGIGLAICRSIIEAHGGRLQATNLAEGGASLKFGLPPNAIVTSKNDCTPVFDRKDSDRFALGAMR
jgi:PAS domain S-box-containing protein